MQRAGFYIALLIVCLVGLGISALYALPSAERRWGDWRAWRRVALGTAFAALVGALLSFSVQSLLRLPQRTQDERHQRQVETQLEELVVAQGHDPMVREFLELKHQQLFASSAEDARRWAEEFLASLPARTREAQSLSEQARVLTARLRLRWEPVYMFLLNAFDERIPVLRDGGVVTNYRKEDGGIVVQEDDMRGQYIARSADFRNSYTVDLVITPARVEYGQLIHVPQLALREVYATGGGAVVYIFLGANSSSVSPDSLKYATVKAGTHQDDPLSDPAFRDALAKAVNELIASAVLRGTSKPSPSP